MVIFGNFTRALRYVSILHMVVWTKDIYIETKDLRGTPSLP